MTETRHNRIRRERFEAAGVNADDIRHARTGYLGEGEDSCALCDTRIKYQFLLRFDRPGGASFVPVGSKCITDWIKAMPESPEREAALANISQAEAEMRREKKEKEIREAKIRRLRPPRGEDGNYDGDGAGLLRRYYDCTAHQRKSAPRAETAEDIAARAVRFGSFSSPKARRFFAVLVKEAESGQRIPQRTAPVAPPAPAPAPEAPPPPPAAPAAERERNNRVSAEAVTDIDTTRRAAPPPATTPAEKVLREIIEKGLISDPTLLAQARAAAGLPFDAPARPAPAGRLTETDVANGAAPF